MHLSHTFLMRHFRQFIFIISILYLFPLNNIWIFILRITCLSYNPIRIFLRLYQMIPIFNNWPIMLLAHTPNTSCSILLSHLHFSVLETTIMRPSSLFLLHMTVYQIFPQFSTKIKAIHSTQHAMNSLHSETISFYIFSQKSSAIHPAPLFSFPHPASDPAPAFTCTMVK